jgi:hypothetical protein
MILAGTLFSLFLAISLVFAGEQLERLRKNPESAMKWQMLRDLLAVCKPLRKYGHKIWS